MLLVLQYCFPMLNSTQVSIHLYSLDVIIYKDQHITTGHNRVAITHATCCNNVMICCIEMLQSFGIVLVQKFWQGWTFRKGMFRTHQRTSSFQVEDITVPLLSVNFFKINVSRIGDQGSRINYFLMSVKFQIDMAMLTTATEACIIKPRTIPIFGLTWDSRFI